MSQPMRGFTCPLANRLINSILPIWGCNEDKWTECQDRDWHGGSRSLIPTFLKPCWSFVVLLLSLLPGLCKSSMWATTLCTLLEEMPHACWAVIGCKGFTSTGPTFGPYQLTIAYWPSISLTRSRQMFPSRSWYYQGVQGPVAFEREV